jgi:hypothetical protein
LKQHEGGSSSSNARQHGHLDVNKRWQLCNWYMQEPLYNGMAPARCRLHLPHGNIATKGIMLLLLLLAGIDERKMSLIHKPLPHMEQLPLLCAWVPLLLVCCVYVLHVGLKKRPERILLLLAQVGAVAEAEGDCHIILVVRRECWEVLQDVLLLRRPPTTSTPSIKPTAAATAAAAAADEYMLAWTRLFAMRLQHYLKVQTWFTAFSAVCRPTSSSCAAFCSAWPAGNCQPVNRQCGLQINGHDAAPASASYLIC